MTRPPHLLYLAWGFPPSRAGGVYRALATVNAFAAAGWDVTVVTASRETFERYTGADASLEERVDPRVVVRRIPFAWPAQDTDVRRYGALRVALPRSGPACDASPTSGRSPSRPTARGAARSRRPRAPCTTTRPWTSRSRRPTRT
ncbi:MAG: hypothetical protein NVV66_04415 [Cellulomonas sp.]|uniref:hypothetical protein n=1 Tax=Cellulomonas sp. TaxID=40001 RepID=UPI002582FD86|nr:hypothetical protein [Cellulomonas sp.]MCR6703948.1 hypothetical protein [Cellulomonas sp.]